MIEREIEIVNRLGLHARAAAKLVHLASGFSCRVSVLFAGEDVDAKSILGLLLLAAPQGSKLGVRCDGPDEERAVNEIAALFADRFGESE
ncbi:MAG: HPr family phosphocarrier protein [Thermoanaerobaculia bacterium]|jgi:phosphotransferase system HPr (HPr) family protein|nr:HPr family phosphocarrier protein [Thermoanaerobaculia bacterium]MBP9822740.1 HPr family phosphocarrier protein [Thermoanaerobaculia bacterium]